MMNNLLLKLGFVVTVLCVSCEAAAQSDVALATRKVELNALSDKLKKRDQQDRRQAQEFSNRAGIPLRRELANGRLLELQRIVPGTGPVFYITNNVDAADTVSTDELWPGGSSLLDLDGAGMIVGEWDGGAIFAEHDDFIGRLTQVDGATLVSGHSTHVAGTLVGAGALPLFPETRGMAYAAHLNAYDWISDTAEMAAAAASGLLISNHSYGIAAGWLYVGDVPPNTWWWIGGAAPTGTEDLNFGYYDTESQLWDQIAYNAPYYLIVKAAGNDRTDTGPAPGEEYSVVDQEGTLLFTSTLSRPADCAPAGYDCLPTNSVAKNILTVGAVDDVNGGYSLYSGPSQVQMAPFSGWGPTDDGRIKPDVVGNGVFLVSAWPEPPYYVAAAAGTSMAAPNVTGSLLLLQQHYQDIYGTGNFLRSATLKALAIHTANEAGGADGPDYEFGWGLLNTQAAAEVISGDGGNHQIIEGSLANGGVDTVQIFVGQTDAKINATLVWMDPPATPVAPTLDAPDLMLVNDLDLRIKKGPSTYMPWVLAPGTPAAAATKGDNFRDNVEKVEAVGGGTGNYAIEVRHKGTLLGGSNQDYSLIISITLPPPVGGGLLIDEDFSAGLPAGWSVNPTTGARWTVNAPVSGDGRLDNLTGGSGQFAIADFNYGTKSVTTMQTPLLDLSSAAAAVLRFRSFHIYDTFETQNVDASINGGADWFNVWQYMGLGSIPMLFTVELPAAIAGQANVRLRFRFDSEGEWSGDLWQVDDVELEVFGGTPPPADPPGQAVSPSPANGANDVAVDANLNWVAGSDAISHDVYFGTSGSPAFQGNQTGTGFDPGTMAETTTYYWRIDEVNGTGTTAGTLWSFTTESPPPAPLPGSATSPGPTDGAANLAVNANLSWAVGTDTDSHDIYFGTNASPAFRGNQTGTVFDPGTMVEATTYYWRIDEVNGTGTTTGTVWSFSTVAAAPSVHLSDLQGLGVPARRGRWDADVTITVMDEDGVPVSGMLVEGDWISGANGVTCTTNGSGECSVSWQNLKGSVASADFAVTDLRATGFDYDSGANEVPEIVTVFKDDPNLQPNAVNDSFVTAVDTILNDNVISNDNQGDAPASITAYDGTSVNGFAVSMLNNGDFSYTPSGGFNGDDSFDYTITDNNGDNSSATVTVTVGSPPPPPTNRTMTLTTSRDKGNNMVLVSWSNFQDSNVIISLNGAPQATVANSLGSWEDSIGKKPSGSFVYEVCEAGPSSACVSDSVSY